MGKSVKKAFSNPIRAATAVGTFGTSELARKISPGVDNALGSAENMFGFGNPNAPRLPSVNGGQNPADLLAQTGGAPLLANIAMGADIDDTLSGYLGVNKAEMLDALNGRNTTINTQDLRAIQSVRNQLTQIQSDRTLKQKAVDQVVQDFPNIVQQNMKLYGDQFDSEMKSYVDQALQGTAAKYAAGGNLSSGAANEAFARVGAENALNKINYSNQNAVRDASLRLSEVNALRDFQNTMLGQVVPQGFSATQANLQRQFQGQMQNAEFANQQKLSDQGSKNALFGALGTLGGTMIGASMFGPAGGAAGGQIGGSLFGSPAPKMTNSSYDSYSGRA
jgi:hypothetical protein